MPPPSPERRPVDMTVLDEHALRMKLRSGIVLPEARKKSVSLARDSFVPYVQAEIGSPVPITVYRYRLLVPVMQVIRESAQATLRLEIATDPDLDNIRDTL